MNKIKVVENKIIPFDNDDVLINDNSITFKKNGNYYIDYIDCDNIGIDVYLEDNVCISLFEYSNNNSIIFKNRYALCKKSSLILSKFYANYSTDEVVNINLNEEGANIKYNFSSIGSGYDKYVMNIYHNCGSTYSDIYNRTVAKEGSTNIFDINSFVENNIKDCELMQKTKIITLGDSNNKINPNMFVGEESITAVHSSIIGSISDDDLFYMMSRGISYSDSINLIVKGIILSNINVDIENRERILKILDNLEVNK